MSGAFRLSCLTAVAVVLAAGAASAETRQVAQAATAAKPIPTAPAAPGLPITDPNVSPCDNFFMHACGPWIAANPIPADQSRWGSFNVLAERNQAILREVLEKAAANPTGETKKIGEFYAACMDEKAIEAKGTAPLKPWMDRINALKDKKALAPLLAELHTAGVNAFHRFGQQQDFKDATLSIGAFDQGGLGLPDRDFYFKDDEKSVSQRNAYVAHVQKMFELAGDKPDAAKAKAAAVMKIETALAEGAMDRVKRRAPENRYHPQTKLADFAALAPSFDWAGYTKAVNVNLGDKFNVGNPDYFKKLEQVIAGNSLDDIKTYLSWQTLRAAAPWLPDAFVQENFNFYGKTLAGTPQIRDRWKRCVDATDGALGEDLGKYYIEKAFGPEHKSRMMTMVGDVVQSFNQMIPTLEWMGPETQAKAKEKLNAIATKVGYPDKWRDYGTLEVKRDDALGNAVRGFAFEYRRDITKIGKPIDRAEWFMTPPTVNAYYSWAYNDINFPAGILQPPFFDMTADDAYNYGAIGGVIGHEITHGFDDQGRKFDARGNLESWWTPADEAKFKERAQCLVDQYSGYQAAEGVNLNGQATLGENTADSGGTRIALKALMNRLGNKKDEKIGGLTADQRFFYGWAHVWCANARPEARRLQALTGVHSLPEYRVNGTLSNMPEFAKAFSCKPADKMVRGEKSCRVW
ncbi:MAG TPA: M13 family metallopeptidase [Azospirillaceae bacterium]|nr:M13 family metallopeptidase [Azospirillaceae bacterium]